jgi:hypothetical protein
MLVNEEATPKDRADQSDDETTEDEQQEATTSSRISLDSNDNLNKGKLPNRIFEGKVCWQVLHEISLSPNFF